ncbi:MAG: RluA family pseudouridine synthase [Planctomycetaceae bacterium]|nr:RluA family pseudouridine synthase [Planctomycetaceae bacterium]
MTFDDDFETLPDDDDAVSPDELEPGELEPDGESFPSKPETLVVTDAESGWRLDLFLVHHFSKYSRMLIRKAIQTESVFVDGRGGKTAYRLKPGQQVTFMPPEIRREAARPENIPLDILYEDDDFVVINKPAHMVVHPSRGHWSGTLVSALAYHFAGLSTVRGPARPGIVHRLDRDTTGAILVAKNDLIHGKLATLFQEKRIQKEYFAVSFGSPNLDRDMIDRPIAHHPKYREKMVISKTDPETKTAQTLYEVVKRYRGMTTFRLFPRTGRTHQIRLHLASLNCPILCDELYGRQSKITQGEIEGTKSSGEVLLSRQALHAHRLAFVHPETGKTMEITAPIPDDMTRTIAAIEKWRT